MCVLRDRADAIRANKSKNKADRAKEDSTIEYLMRSAVKRKIDKLDGNLDDLLMLLHTRSVSHGR